MLQDLSDLERRRLPAAFTDAAEDYDRTRPVCPPELFDDLVELTGLAAGDRVLEIGCGTGQATVPLAQRALAVTAIEVGPALAAIARRRLADFPSTRVLTGSFEDWEPEGRPFDAVVAFNSLHWIDPEVRYRKPAGLLRAGGLMVVGSCLWAVPPDAERFWTDVQETTGPSASKAGRRRRPRPSGRGTSPRRPAPSFRRWLRGVTRSASPIQRRTTWPTWGLIWRAPARGAATGRVPRPGAGSPRRMAATDRVLRSAADGGPDGGGRRPRVAALLHPVRPVLERL